MRIERGEFQYLPAFVPFLGMFSFVETGVFDIHRLFGEKFVILVLLLG